METDQPIAVTDKRKKNFEIGAKITLILITSNIIWQLAAIYQTRYQLASPIIPQSAVWDINKQFVFQAIFSASVSLIALILYFFDKYLFVIILVVSALMISRYIYM